MNSSRKVDVHDWTVVQFCELDGNTSISTVPTNWLVTSSSCYWPSKTNDARKKILKREEPDAKSWQICNFQRILKQTDDYKEALQYEKWKLTHSSASSGPENSEMGRGKRKKKHKNRSLLDPELTSDVESNTSEESLDTPPPSPPPSLCSKKVNPQNITITEDNGISDDKLLETAGIIENDLLMLASKTCSSSNREVHEPRHISRNSNSGYILEINEAEPGNSNSGDVAFNNNSNETEPDNSNSGDVEFNNNSNKAEPVSEKIISDNSTILKQILTNTTAIRLMLQNQQEFLENMAIGRTASKAVEFQNVPQKPFKKYSKLLEFDEMLKSDENVKLEMETYLFLIGGATAKHHVKNGLQKLFTNKLATKCSWCGRGSNYALQNLKLMDIFRVAVRKNFASLKENEFHQMVSAWFVQAGLRLTREKIVKQK